MSTDYDAVAKEYKRLKLAPWRTCLGRYSLLNLLGEVRGKSVLDLACGEGFYSRLIREQDAARVVGVDLSSGMIDLAIAAEKELGGYRDCSSTILDIFLPFALPLPRNSRSQAGAGKNVTIEHLSLAEKREHILATAAPFRTILNLDGHNMLYLGVFEGSPVAFHTIWGLRTESVDESRAGRYLIGKSVITSLSPGRELSELSRSRGDLLSRIRSFTLL